MNKALLCFLVIASCCLAISSAKIPYKQHTIITSDPCNQWPNCSVCIANKFCGWCSTPVKYEDGSRGYQCAGFDPNNKTNPFICVGTYSTDKCAVGYNCSAATKQCVETAPGNGEPLSVCNATCNPKYYSCSPKNVSCVETPQNEGGIPMDVCQAQCKAQNNTPSDIVGLWRGLEISGGFVSGEWKLQITASNASLYNPAGGSVWHGTVSQVETYVVITINSGANAGMKIFALYQTQMGPVTKWVTIAASRPGANPPLTFDEAMASPTAQEFVFISCVDSSICNFGNATATLTTYEKSLRLKKKVVEPEVPDRCSVYPNCTACLDVPFCGWCSTNVIYSGNVLGKNCAGFNTNGTDAPFVCVGTYSTQKCPVPPPVYACQSNTSQCVVAQSGTPQSVCNATCGKNNTNIKYQCNVAKLICEPNNGGQDQATCNATCNPRPFPVALEGVYRGLEVSKNYAKGEWRMVIKGNTTFTGSFQITNPVNITISGQVEHVAAEPVLIFTITSPVAAKMYSLYELAYGPETTYVTLANGRTDSEQYPSFIEAMTGDGMSELNFISCLNPLICKF